MPSNILIQPTTLSSSKTWPTKCAMCAEAKINHKTSPITIRTTISVTRNRYRPRHGKEKTTCYASFAPSDVADATTTPSALNPCMCIAPRIAAPCATEQKTERKTSSVRHASIRFAARKQGKWRYSNPNTVLAGCTGAHVRQSRFDI